MTAAADNEQFSFGEFRLDPGRRELLRGGAPVPLKSRALDVLCVLASAQGEVVSKNELMARVWPGVVVEENNLAVHVSALRKTLGERFVMTVPGRGYRLIGAQAMGRRDDSGQGLALPDKPSIAVLPFVNLSGDPEQDYFADGVVEEIIVGLSRMRWLFVIARNSSFTYKGRAVDVKQVGAELGVRYVLEGSVRKVGQRVRITAQLIDAATGVHVSAERFDGALDDIFELQDQVMTKVLGALGPNLERAEIERAGRKPTESLDAYDCYLRALANVHQLENRLDEALLLIDRASELDPRYAAPHGLAALCYVRRLTNGWVTDVAKETAEAARRARRVMELGGTDAVALACAAYALCQVVHEVDEAAGLIDRALALNPNLALAWLASGLVRAYRLGEHDTAIDHVSRAMRLSPLDSRMYLMQAVMAFAHFSAGRYDEAVAWADRALAMGPLGSTMRTAAASHAFAGRLEQAQAMIERYLALDPTARLSNLAGRIGPFAPRDLARFIEGLRKAGLPE